MAAALVRRKRSLVLLWRNAGRMMLSAGSTLLLIAATGCAGNQAASSRVFAASELRDLADDEKKIIAEAVSAGMPAQKFRNFRWAKFPTQAPAGGNVQYCATADGRPFIATVTVSNGRASSAWLIAVGGPYVETECRRHYETPFA